MNESRQTPTNPRSSALSAIPIGWLVSAATTPVLLGLVGGKALAEAIQGLGQMSEEIFRGDRLPLLKFPAQPTVDPESQLTDSASD